MIYVCGCTTYSDTIIEMMLTHQCSNFKVNIGNNFFVALFSCFSHNQQCSSVRLHDHSYLPDCRYSTGQNAQANHSSHPHLGGHLFQLSPPKASFSAAPKNHSQQGQCANSGTDKTVFVKKTVCCTIWTSSPLFWMNFQKTAKKKLRWGFLPWLACMVGWAAHLPPKWPALHLHETTRHVPAYILWYSKRRPQSLRLQMLPWTDFSKDIIISVKTTHFSLAIASSGVISGTLEELDWAPSNIPSPSSPAGSSSWPSMTVLYTSSSTDRADILQYQKNLKKWVLHIC